MTDKTLYTLKPGITLTISEPDEDGWENFSFGDTKDVCWLDADDFRELFQPVDVVKQKTAIAEAIENQVWDIFNEIGWDISREQLSESGGEQVGDRLDKITQAVWRVLYPNTEQETT